MHKPLVSVIIPVYNREETIQRAISSVINQTYENLEILVVDDGSTDKTCEIVAGFEDKRIRMIHRAERGGAAGARNRGMTEAMGEYIAFQDSDDEWLPFKLEKQIEFMLENEFQVSYSPYRLCDDTVEKIVPDNYTDTEKYGKKIQEILKKGNAIGTPTLVLHRQVIDQIGMFDEQLKALEDYEYAIRLSQAYEIGYINTPMMNAYRMNKCISNDKAALQDAIARMIQKHMGFVDMQSMLYSYFDTCGLEDIDAVGLASVDELISKWDKSFGQKYAGQCYEYAMKYIYQKYCQVKNALIESYEDFKAGLQSGQFAIYGAGHFGKEVFRKLSAEGLLPKCFVVSKQDENTFVEDIPVWDLQKCHDLKIPVIIAVSWDKQGDIVKLLRENGWYQYCVYPFG